MKRGDHIVSPRFGYSHHGLYIGNGSVIHYSGFSEAFDKGTIEITTIDEFTQGNGHIIEHHFVCIYDEEERVERAFSKLGEDSYNLIFNNCEHFVNWCFGFKISPQVHKAVHVTATFADEYVKRKETKTVVSLFAQQVGRATLTKTAEAAVTSALAKSAVSTTVGTAAGVTAVSAVTSTTAAGIASVFAAGSVASVAAPVVIAVGIGYGVKKVFDWLLD